jgi:hypothetical protein
MRYAIAGLPAAQGAASEAVDSRGRVAYSEGEGSSVAGSADRYPARRVIQIREYDGLPGAPDSSLVEIVVIEVAPVPPNFYGPESVNAQLDDLVQTVEESARVSGVDAYHLEERYIHHHWGAAHDSQQVIIQVVSDPGVRAVVAGAMGGALSGGVSAMTSRLIDWALGERGESEAAPATESDLASTITMVKSWVSSGFAASQDDLLVVDAHQELEHYTVELKDTRTNRRFEAVVSRNGNLMRFRERN